ncbi:YbjN domain-containing protein [Deinococcus radiophilus]|uniref:YbjN domain-containing protein n=1 Tax=Deinococcus radiophilus TaxID=32062 RepID=A0A3S0I9E2_9DEIO|nr:YbjN domain-containing protein [Deinococcus radiophilus]RTR28290.1 YbjN domain-containing protein [Deinococcus radiophilus]UFA51151.1 YbjN domain-containing protein [Deinococcus radiophilus]
MTTETALLTLDTLANYLKERDVQLEMDQNPETGQRFIRMGWRFEMGDAAVLVSVNDGPQNTSRLEITCVTQKTYEGRMQEVMEMLNLRNRERAFSRSIDQQGNVWLEYVGFYPTLAEMPQETFDTLFGGVLMHFQDDYAALEGVQLQPQQPQA